ncbi:hypothetical protein V1291_002437 [Nitrobacteraceae bacterium AZCC 1564]
MMAIRTFATPLLLARGLALGACAVGPGYRPPEISAIAKEPFKKAAATGVDSASPKIGDIGKSSSFGYSLGAADLVDVPQLRRGSGQDSAGAGRLRRVAG